MEERKDFAGFERTGVNELGDGKCQVTFAVSPKEGRVFHIFLPALKANLS